MKLYEYRLIINEVTINGVRDCVISKVTGTSWWIQIFIWKLTLKPDNYRISKHWFVVGVITYSVIISHISRPLSPLKRRM